MGFQIPVTMYKIGSFRLSPAETRTIPMEGATIEYAVDDAIPYIKSLIRFKTPGQQTVETAYVAETVASIVAQSTEGGSGGGGSSLTEVTVDESGSPVTLNMNGNQEQLFVGTPAISAPVTIQMTNVTSALRFTYFFNLSGLSALTLPSNFILNDARWNNGTKVWTPLDTGNYKMVGTYDGTNWWVEITGGTYQ